MLKFLHIRLHNVKTKAFLIKNYHNRKLRAIFAIFLESNKYLSGNLITKYKKMLHTRIHLCFTPFQSSSPNTILYCFCNSKYVTIQPIL